MESVEAHGEYIQSVLDSLSEENMSRLDFDELKSWLGDQAGVISELVESRNDCQLLRDDLEGKIGGMVKAMAAADRKRDSAESALELVESLHELSAEGLVKCYGRVSARFRDMFPSSLGGRVVRTASHFGTQNISDYK